MKIKVNLYRWKPKDILDFKDALHDAARQSDPDNKNRLEFKRAGELSYWVSGDEAELRSLLDNWFDEKDIEDMLNPEKNESYIDKALNILSEAKGKWVIARGAEGDIGDHSYLTVQGKWVKPSSTGFLTFATEDEAEDYLHEISDDFEWHADADGYFMDGKWEIYVSKLK